MLRLIRRWIRRQRMEDEDRTITDEEIKKYFEVEEGDEDDE